MMEEKKFARPLPFELLIRPQNDGGPPNLFIQTVEQVLTEKLQSANSFGCTISNCHTHVGSKKHLGSFVEAELLFHNSYYNKGFAYLATEKILKCISSSETPPKAVWLIGYETFSELFLCEARDLLSADYPTDYCVFETVNAESSRIRGLSRLLEQGKEDFLNGQVCLAFIVPISTTLTTHDKLISAFREEAQRLCGTDSWIERERVINLTLILISDTDGKPYWTMDEVERVLIPNEKEDGLFQSLQEACKVHYFAWIPSQWYDAEKCPFCFPDIGLNPASLTQESPIFEVNRASVVPMLQLGIDHIPAPKETPWEQTAEEQNIHRVIRLSRCMYHHHILRNGNHYQYYFNTEEYFRQERRNVKDWLETKVKQKIYIRPNAENGPIAVYHIIVAPRHFSNADFLHEVSEAVFDGTARIFFFDVQREYRGNIEAKFSDFTQFVRNISICQEAFQIHFHYVDDSIYMGTNFFRTKSLIQTLVSGHADGQVSVFESIILLVGRNSPGTKRHLLQNTEHFFEYVHLDISPMRNHEDACTLCQLAENFQLMADTCSTNSMNKECLDRIKNHRLIPSENFFHENFADFGKQMRVILRHMISIRLKNKWSISEGSERRPEPVVNHEDEEDVYWVLKQFHEDIKRSNGKIAGMYRDASSGGSYDVKAAERAFFKVISRPFFSYSIRQKQGAFRFCLEQFEETLCGEKREVDIALVAVQINALADMEANYLIRVRTMDRLFKLTEEEGLRSLQEGYFLAIKKLVVTSQDTAKAVLLETVLTTGSEQDFFHAGDNAPLGGKLSKTLALEPWLRLYLENSRLLQEGFSKVYHLKKYDVLQHPPYYLRRFRDVFSLNLGTSPQEMRFRDKIVERYCQLKERLSSGLDLSEFGTFTNLIQEFFPELPEPPQLFICNTLYQDGNNRYTLLFGDDNAQNSFYASDFQSRLEDILEDDDNTSRTAIADTFFSKDDEDFCIIKFEDCPPQEEEEHAAVPDIHRELFCRIPFPNKQSFSSLCTKGHTLDRRGTDFLRFFFGVKLLLSLRGEFVKMAQENFNNNAINRLVLEDNRNQALSISKASRHGSAQYYSRFDYTKIKKIHEDTESRESLNYISLLDQYIQLLANDFISSLYREANSGQLFTEDVLQGNEVIDPNSSDSVLATQMYRLLFQKRTEESPDDYCYEMEGPCKEQNNSTIPAKLNLIIQGFPPPGRGRWVVKCLARNDSSISPTLLILFLLATNARFHTPKELPCEVKVCRDGQYLCVSNRVPGAQESAGKASKSLRSRPHWTQRKSITLWTLNQYCAAVNGDRSAPQTPLIIVEAPEEDLFQVKLPLFEEDNEV